jgi:FlaG/FlaF family flagellin (archaellin)
MKEGGATPMTATILEITALVVVFAACILWASDAKPLSEMSHEDEIMSKSRR